MKIINEQLLDETQAKALQSPRLRMNYNFHERLDDPINRLLNAMEPGTYLRWQNLFVVAVSYLFYGWWDWRFLLLILFTSLCSYLSGVYLEKCAGNRSVQKWISAGNILLNLSILGVFKYFDFFTENLVNVLHLLGPPLIGGRN